MMKIFKKIKFSLVSKASFVKYDVEFCAMLSVILLIKLSKI